jgi:hypothetical protein
LAIEEKYVGSLDDPPPLGQTFAKIQTWDQLFTFVKDIVQDNQATLDAWWDLARAIRAQVEVLDTVRGNFTRLLADLEHEFRGAAGRAVQARGAEIVAYMKTVADALRESPVPIDQTGHDIKVYAKAFWDAKNVFDKLADAEAEAFVKWMKSWYHNAKAMWTEGHRKRAEAAARQMVEQNLHLPHQRKLLMILAAKYADKHSRLEPFSIQIEQTEYQYSGGFGPGPGGNGPGGNDSGSNFIPDPESLFGQGPGSSHSNRSGGGSGGRGAGSGPGASAGADQARRAAAKAANDAINRMMANAAGAGFDPGGSGLGPGIDTSGSGLGIGGGAGGLPTGSAGVGSSGPGLSLRSAMPGLGSDFGSGGSGVPAALPAYSPLGRALPDYIDSLLPGGSSGAGSGSALSLPQRRALEDARRAALAEIDALRRPGDSAVRTQALDDAKRAVGDAIDDLAGTGLAGLTDRADVLRAARAAVAQTIGDLLDDDPGPGGSGPLSDSAARERALALQQARDAADRAISGLLEQAQPATSDLGAAVRSAALEQARSAIDGALEDLAASLDGVAAQERAIRHDALADVRQAADDIISDLLKETPKAGSLTEIRDDALADLRRELTDAFDELIEDTTENRSLPDADKAVRVDAIADAKDAALRALEGLSTWEQSDLSRFLTGGAGSGGSAGTGAGLSSGGTSPGGATGVRTGLGAQLGIVPASAGGGAGQPATAPLFSPVVDPAALANQGMPMAPPLGGAGMGGPGKERQRSTWVDGDPAVWRDEDDEAVSAQAIGRGDAQSER